MTSVRKQPRDLIRLVWIVLGVKSAVTAGVLILMVGAMFGLPSLIRQPATLLPARDASVFVLLAAGLAIGCYGTLVGIGGGPLIVPILCLFYSWSSECLVATTLFIVFLNAFSGSVGYALQERVDYRGGLKFALAALPGAVITSVVHHLVDISSFRTIFAGFLILLALYAFLSVNGIGVKPGSPPHTRVPGHRQVSFVDAFGERFSYSSNDGLGIGMSALAGFLVGFLGIGGGVLQVPILAFLLRYPVHIATATSHFITMLVCLGALIPHMFLGNVFFREALWMGVAVVVGAQCGAKLAPHAKGRVIIYLFIVVLLVFAFTMFR